MTNSIFATGGPISAAATVADLNGHGRPVVIVGSDALYAWHVDDGSHLAGFPVRGRNFFASRPLVADLYGDGEKAIIVGCDDDSLYGFDSSGRPLPGFPIPTGGDVYSSPVAADLNGDGILEIVVGSDDGSVYVWRADGALLPSWPQKTGGFVSASPVIVDLDGDGKLEIAISSWDKMVYAWRADGTTLPGWPQKTGHFVWSSPRVADLTGDGNLEVIAASDRVYAWRADGAALPGWPQETGSYVVGQPLITDLTGDGQMDVIVAADRLYAWDSGGQILPGFPLDLGTFFWSAPAVGALEGNGRPTFFTCGWNGCLYAIGANGLVGSLKLSTDPIFATPTLADPTSNGYQEIFVGAWDSQLYVANNLLKENEPIQPEAGVHVWPAEELTSVKEAEAPFIQFPGPVSPQATMTYRSDTESDWHPVPLVNHQGQMTGLVQPFPAGTTVRFWAESDGRRMPETGTYNYSVRTDIRGRISRKIRKWKTAL
jgi:WD40 repeat protein